MRVFKTLGLDFSPAMLSILKTTYLYSLNGESRSDKRIKLIEAFNILNTTDENEIQVMDDTSVSFLYFFDADDKGTAQRRTEVNDELSGVFKDKFSPI